MTTAAERPTRCIWVELPAGTYIIMANSLRAGEIGAYELVFAAVSSDEGTELLAGSISRGSLETSDSIFNDGSHYDEWNYSGQGGEGVTVTMISDEVDSYLMAYLGSSVAGERLGDNNDGGGGRNAEISLTLPATGTYTFAANSYRGGQTGRYQLSVESGGSASRTYTTGGPSNGKYALLVGIDDYPGIGNDLNSPVEDARIMYRALTERFGFDPANIVVLNDSDATRENIANGVIEHLGQAGPDGVAVLFFSGHGIQMGENIGLTGALDPENAVTATKPSSYTATAGNLRFCWTRSWASLSRPSTPAERSWSWTHVSQVKSPGAPPTARSRKSSTSTTRRSPRAFGCRRTSLAPS